MKSISFFEKTKKREFIDCRITCFRDYFNFYGVNFDSNDIFILSQCMNSSIYQYKLQKIPFSFLLFAGTTFEFEKNIFNALNIKYTEQFFGDDIMQVIKEYIDNDTPLIFEFDIRRVIDSKIVPKKIDIHCISDSLVFGYNLYENNIRIDLKDGKKENYKDISIDAFEKSITANTFPLELKKKYYNINEKSIDVSFINSNKEEILKKVLIDYCNNLINDRSYFLDNMYEDKEIITGPSVFDRIESNSTLIKNLLYDNFDNSEVNKRLFVFYYMSLRDMLTPGSEYCYRREFSYVLNSMAEKLNKKEFNEIANNFDNIALNWRDLTRKLYFCSKVKTKNDFIDFLTLIGNILKNIKIDEMKNYHELIRILE